MRPRVAIEVFLFNSEGNKFLMINKNNNLSLPYSLLEYSEDFEQCAQRCLKEKLDLLINDIQMYTYLCSFNCLDKRSNFHRIEIFYSITLKEGQNIKDECNFVWYSYDEIEKNNNLSIPLQTFFKNYDITNNEDILELRAP